MTAEKASSVFWDHRASKWQSRIQTTFKKHLFPHISHWRVINVCWKLALELSKFALSMLITWFHWHTWFLSPEMQLLTVEILYISLGCRKKKSLMSFFFSIVVIWGEKAKSKVSFPYRAYKQKPEVRSSPTGLKQNCSSRWTHLLLLMAQHFPRGWHGATVCLSSSMAVVSRALWAEVQAMRAIAHELSWYQWQPFHMFVFR